MINPMHAREIHLLNKKMKKLEKKFEAAKGRPITMARLQKTAASTLRRIEHLENAP